MKLEVLIRDLSPKIYNLDKPKILVGSHESSHIIINDPTISRKHVILTFKENHLYISDQGSINGTFFREEQLIPGKRIEMTIGEPIRLGSNILLTLITDDEAAELEEILPLNEYEGGREAEEEKTSVIHYSELRAAKTEHLEKKRKENLPRRKKKAKKKPSLVTPVLIVIFLCAILFGALNKKNEKQAFREPVSNIESQQIINASLEDMLDKQALIEAFQKPKCNSDFEKTICLALPAVNYRNFGPVVLEKNIIIFADSSEVLIEAGNYLGQKEKVGHELDRLALILWIRKNISEKIEEIKDIDKYQITIALMKEERVLVNSVFIPHTLVQFTKRINAENLEKIKENGFIEFYYHLEYGKFQNEETTI